MPTPRLCRLATLLLLALPATPLQAESFRRAGTEFNAMRPVSLPPGKTGPVVVTEFFHHGEISADGRNVVVCGKNQELVPSRVLQLGPGDFCRLAFQTVRGQTSYEIFYGGDPPSEKPPEWTCRDGLLLATRHYKDCNLNSLESVRAAFDSARPIGADYVEAVHHSHNPFSLKDESFLSHYSGYLHVSTAGTYGFLTSSHDASFLLIDDKQVIAAPGRHGPAHNAQRGSRGDVKLSAGAHKFDYYHACAGGEPMMVAAWEINPPDVKPQPKAIPPETFLTQSIVRVPAGRLTLRATKMVPDFLVKIAGEVPLPDNSVPLVGVIFRDASVQALTMNARVRWDFGDGQTSDKPNAEHVYLHPGVYTVKLAVKHAGGKAVEIVNRIYFDRPLVLAAPKEKERQHSLDDYLPILRDYDPKTLDAASLRQLVLAYEAKSLAVQDQVEEVQKKRRADKDKEPETATKDPSSDALAKARQYIAAAVAAGKTPFVEEAAATGDEDLLALARLVGPMARDQLGESELAFQIWQGAARKLSAAEAKADCEIEAADIAVNDLVKPAAAKPLLESATAHLGRGKSGAAAALLQRVWGDYDAATGDGKSARKAYGDAEQIVRSARNYTARTAWQGAHSRSTEAFIKEGQLDRAARQIRAWQREFPAEKIDGYLTLMYARYWAVRKQYAAAVAQSEQLLAVNPDSPYADQLLLLAADCEVRRGKTDRALATLHSLVKDYPGSPLVPVVKKHIERLEGKKP